MRYTTIIDISQCPEIYKNRHARLVYLHLCLKSGYHDHDRDLVRTSIRILAADTGLSVSAVRNAVKQLIKWRLLELQNGIYKVTKWVPEQTISSRPKTSKQQRADELAAERARQNEVREREAELDRIRREKLAASGRNSLDEYKDYLRARAAAGDIDAQTNLRRRGWD